jgi:alpha-1,2-mannosyltransferase
MPSNFARMLDGRRVFRLCGILLAVEIGLFLFLAAGTYDLIVPLPKPTTTDFVSFYAAGALADAGTPELAYNRDAHFAAEERGDKAWDRL